PWTHLPFILGAIMVAIKSQSMGLKFYNPNIKSTPLENALYASLSRPVFAIAAVSIVVLISVSDRSEFHHKFFKPRWAQPLAKLTYGVYLIHNINQSYDIGVARNAKTFSLHNVIWDLVPDVIFSFLLSLILSLVIEGPFRRIEKRLITKRSHKQTLVNYSEECEEEKNNIISSELEDNFGSIKKHDVINLEMKMKPWYLRVPLLPILFATSPTLPEGKCKKQVQKYLEELNNGTLWAVRKLALCVPDACNEEDIKKALDEPLKKFGLEEGLLIKTGVKGQCQSQSTSPKFSTSAKIYCCIILGLFFLVAVSTLYDLTLNDVKDEENKSSLVGILLCFSVQRNFKSVTNINIGHPGLDAIYLFRVFFMCCTILGHRSLQYYTNSVINSEYLESTHTSSSFILLHNGPIIVEIFFTFGGVLLAYYMLINLDKTKKTNFIMAISIRYLRFTPSYAVVIFFIALILPHLGAGPDWDYKIASLESSNCADNWWTNLLYINNYVNTNKLCMFQSWYISVDFHLYIMALFVIYLFWKMPRKFGYPFLIVIIIAGCAIPFYITYVYNVQPLLMLTPRIRDVKEDFYYIEHYIKTHERIASYFIGVLGGAIIYDHSLSPWTIKRRWVSSLIIISSILVAIKTLSMGLKFHDPNINPPLFEKALYASLNRPIVALATVVIGIVQSVSDQSEFYHKLFTPRWAQPIARLTYGAYLLNTIPQAFDMGIARSARIFSLHDLFYNSVTDIFVSFLLALILSLVVEGPFRRIEKQIITKRSAKQKLYSDSWISKNNERYEEKRINNCDTSTSDDDFKSIKKHNLTDIEIKKFPWYLKVPLLPILFATSPTLPEGKCKKQVQKYLEELNNGTLWAVRKFDPNASVWEAIKERGDFRRFKRYLLELALCVPDACNEEDIKKALDEPLKKFGLDEGLLIKTGVKGQCQSQSTSPKFSTFTMLGLFLLVSVSTWLNSTMNYVQEESNSVVVDILQCFSAQRNFKYLKTITYNHKGLDKYLESAYNTPTYMIFYNSPLCIAIYFTFGGILMSYNMLKELDKKKNKSFIHAILVRYFRFTPSYLVVIFFIALILPHVGFGPYWDYKIGLDSGNCADNWWANVLYINNYVNTNKLDLREDTYFIDHYIKSHERLASYFIGVLGGAIIYDHSLSPWNIPKHSIRIFIIICSCLMSIKTLSLGMNYYDPNVNHSLLQSAFYAGLSRPAIALTTMFVLVILTMNNPSDNYYNFLTPRWAQPFAKLTYGAYLIHPILQSYDIGSERSALTCYPFYIIQDIILDLVFTFSLSLVLLFVVEEPFRRIEKQFITKRLPQANEVEKYK
ncbi:hypothetical protein PV326_006605, partial [Microctonus aethiopoides]